MLALCCAVAAARAEPTPEASARFDVLEFRVLGSHVLGTREVERAVYPFLGPARDLPTVQAAAAALEKAYRDAGYGTVIVDVPEQTVDDGIVRLRVTEATVERIHVRGPLYFSARQIRAELPALVAGATPRLPELQRELTTLNAETPDRAVTPVLKAGQRPGTVDIDLITKDELPLHGSVQYDNRHTADTTPNRLTAMLSYDNLWQRRDSVSLEYQTAPAAIRQAEVLSASYGLRAGADGERLVLGYIHTSSDVPALSTLGVLGRGSIYNAHWLQPLVRDSVEAQSLDFGVDYKSVQTQVSTPSTTPSGAPSVAVVSSPVRYVNWSAAYSATAQGERGFLGANLGVGLGLRGFVNDAAEFQNARYLGQPGYLYLRGSGQVLARLPAGFALLGRVAGQWSQDPLVNNEQFALGGLDTVRGYLEAETLGDGGAAGSVELRSPGFGAIVAPALQPLLAFVFFDAGVATLEYPLPGQAYHVRLRSSGVGLRLDSAKGWTGLVDYALPGVDGVRTRKGDSRFDFSVRYGF